MANFNSPFASVVTIHPPKNGRFLTIIFLLPLFHSYSSLACSPSIDAEHDIESEFGLNRRSSSGALLSPEVELTGSITKPIADALETDGFYMLKKDSQRRTTLSKVLGHDEAKICDVWMQKIENNHKVKVVISKV